MGWGRIGYVVALDNAVSSDTPLFMRIRLTATSNIPSGNPTLRPLLEVAELDFGRFGDWFEVLTGSGYQDVTVAWVLFFRDILAREDEL
jgi:hypothetical protein